MCVLLYQKCIMDQLNCEFMHVCCESTLYMKANHMSLHACVHIQGFIL